MKENEINFGRYSTKTKRQIEAEKIPDKYPFSKRLFVAIFDIVANGIEPDYTTFCKVNDINARNLQKYIEQPRLRPKIDYFAILVSKYGYSADWLLTGRGEMKN